MQKSAVVSPPPTKVPPLTGRGATARIGRVLRWGVTALAWPAKFAAGSYRQSCTRCTAEGHDIG